MLTFSVASNTLVLSNTSLNPIQTEGGFGGGEYRMLPARSLDVYNFCDNQATLVTSSKIYLDAIWRSKSSIHSFSF